MWKPPPGANTVGGVREPPYCPSFPEVSSRSRGARRTCSHICTSRTPHDHCPGQPEPSTTAPPVPGALHAPQGRGHRWVQSHPCLFCDLGQLTFPTRASVFRMATGLVTSLSCMRNEQCYVCENCARCLAGGMCQVFLLPLSPPCLPPPPARPFRPAPSLPPLPRCTPFKQPPHLLTTWISPLCAHLHPGS